MKKFIEFIKEDYETGYINYNDMPLKLKIIDNPTTVKIIYKGKHYEDLSIIIPDSKHLDNGEFFINPDIDRNIIKEFEIEGFIECTNKESMAGDKLTKSYKLI